MTPEPRHLRLWQLCLCAAHDAPARCRGHVGVHRWCAVLAGFCAVLFIVRPGGQIPWEDAAAFEDLTLSGRDRDLPEQHDHSWPNAFRQTRMISAVELVQADRFRRKVMQVMTDVMGKVGLLFAPQKSNPLLSITNCTGHPAIAIPMGFAWRQDDVCAPAAKRDAKIKLLPHCSVLWGRLHDDSRLIRVAMALEAATGLQALAAPAL